MRIGAAEGDSADQAFLRCGGEIDNFLKIDGSALGIRSGQSRFVDVARLVDLERLMRATGKGVDSGSGGSFAGASLGHN